jgi:hypothetical protein
MSNKIQAVIYRCKSTDQLHRAVSWCNLLLKHLSRTNSTMYQLAHPLIKQCIHVQEYRLNLKLQGAIDNVYGKVEAK